MGIQVEFNPDLALRAYGTIGRLEVECIPEKIEEGEIYTALKTGQRNYWFNGLVPLRETKGNQILSRPLAAIEILEATHYLQEPDETRFFAPEICTRIKYNVIRKFDPNDKSIRFEGLDLIG